MAENLYDLFTPDAHLMDGLNRSYGKKQIENKSKKGGAANSIVNKNIIKFGDKEEKRTEKEKREKSYAGNDELGHSSDSREQSVYSYNDNICSGSKKKESTRDLAKYEMDENVKIAVKIATQYILNIQPFPVKRSDLFNLINYHLPNRFSSYKKREAVIYLTRMHFRQNLDLNLLEMEHNKNKEYVLSQRVLYEPHNNALISHWEHRIRGLLIFLLLPFKIYENKIPLGYLLETLGDCGWKSTKTKEEIAMFICSQKYNNKDNLLSILKRVNVDIEYLLAYIKILEYIDICLPQSTKEHEIDDYFCVASSRYEQEISCDPFIKKLMKIPDTDYYSSDISYIFP